MHLPQPSQFLGNNFDIWFVSMESYPHFVDAYNELYVEAKEALTLYLIQQALDKILLHKVAIGTTLNKSCNIPKTKYSEKGRNIL